MAISGKVAAVYAQTNDAPLAFVDEATTTNADKTRYAITNASKRYWDKNTTVTVKKNGVIQTTGFSLEYAGGVVVFDVPLTTEVITVTGASLAVDQPGGFFNWSVEPQADTQETTAFEGTGWKTFVGGLKEWSGSAESYFSNDSRFFDNLGKEVVIVFYVDSGVNKYRFEGFGIINGDGIEANVGEVIPESIEFQGVGPLYYREG